MQSFDIAIIGGGMTGLALACGLKDCGLRIAVLEQRPPTPPFNAEFVEPGLRVSAINPASERLLRYLNAWQYLPQSRLTAYRAMEVWERDSFARIDFQADSFGYQHLGHIIENDQIQQALWQSAKDCADIQQVASSPVDVNRGDNEAFITLADGSHLSAKLVVGADGANSWLRRQADIPIAFRDYGQQALVATIRTEEHHQDCARQIFTGAEILAFLPLYQENLCSIVWSTDAERAQMLLSCNESDFNRQLTVAFDGRLGLCRLESERRAFPLTARFAQRFADHRLALIGDAAHTIHPLAGLGVNLGFMDAANLIDTIKRLHKSGRDIGSYHSLRGYERSRKYDAAVTLAAMQGFRQLFDGVNPAKKLFRDIGLTLADRLPGAKTLFVRQAVGLDRLPDWLADGL
jgi:2-octaprenylphenol hydroxylase